MKQVLPKVTSLFDYHTMKMMLFQDESWTDIDTINSSILELSLPQDKEGSRGRRCRYPRILSRSQNVKR